MFGFGNTRNSRRQVRNDTFGGSNIRNAAIAGVGMLAWRWWRNRQSSGNQMSRNQLSGDQPVHGQGISGQSMSGGSTQDRTFSERTTQPADSIYS
jgi:hypothetical protein